MKIQFLAALLLTAATVTFAPSANAAESKAVESIQSTRLEFLNNQTKAIDDVQSARLAGLDARSKSTLR